MSLRDTPYDFLVIGSGIAGLTFALRASEHGQVCVVSKSRLEECNTLYAQGGVAAVTSAEDSFDLHVEDTLNAGAGLCREEAVRLVVEGGPAAIQYLVDLGVDFKRKSGSGDGWDLGKEGGHSRRRVLHVADSTGRAIETQLIEAAEANDNITLLPNQMAVDLLTVSHHIGGSGPNRCLGAYLLDRVTGDIRTVPEKARKTQAAAATAAMPARSPGLAWISGSGTGVSRMMLRPIRSESAAGTRWRSLG